MKYVTTGSRLGLAFVLSAVFTACVSLAVQVVAAEEASVSKLRPGAGITRYPVKMRLLRGTLPPAAYRGSQTSSKSN